MTVSVSAVVLSHDEPESLTRVLNQLARQTVSPSRILILDSSKTEVIDSQGFETIKLKHRTSFAQAMDIAVGHLNSGDYLWILHDDSAPHDDALEHLLREIELSPSLAVVGPKQLDWDNPKLIRQLGLTLTPGGRLFSRVRGEFDQGQHDRAEDVMAVGTAGALINSEKYRELMGFDPKAPPLAADVDFSIRARLSGGRVAVAPNSKISHRMLSMNGGRPRHWLAGTPAKAIRQAELYLALSYASFPSFVVGWLFLIPFSILSSLVLLVRKRSSEIPAELSAALTTFLQPGKILSSRARIRKTTSARLSSLAGLRASRQEIRTSNQRAKDTEVSKQLLAAHARGDNEQITPSKNSGFLDSGAIWFALGLIGLQVLWFPTNVAVTGAGVTPLSGNWLEIFAQAGSTSQNLGLGFTAAADPWDWVLAILSAPTFFQPNLSITLFLFLATAIAFTGFFFLSSLVTQSGPLRITGSLVYALWPAMTISVTETRFAQLLAIVLLPFLVHSIARLAQLGSPNPGAFISSWSEVGRSGILLALISASSPVLGLVLVVLIVTLGIFRPKKLPALLFSTFLTLVWFFPIALERLSVQPISLLIAPGLQSGSQPEANWTLPFFGFSFTALDYGLLITVPVALFALLALLGPAYRSALGVWLIALLALTVAYLGAGVSFGEVSAPSLEINPLLALFGLALSLALLKLGSSGRGLRTVAIAAVAVIGIAPAAASLAVNPPELSYSDGRIVPSIIQADADTGVDVRTLRLQITEDEVLAELFEGSGVKLEKLSTAFEIQRAELIEQNADYDLLGQLVANLVSANGADVVGPLEKFGISYILVSPANRDLQMALDSTRGLESIGETDFGQLWKVQSVVAKPKTEPLDFNATKLASLGALGLYVLLALPTGSVRKRNGKQSEIFVDVEETN